MPSESPQMISGIVSIPCTRPPAVVDAEPFVTLTWSFDGDGQTRGPRQHMSGVRPHRAGARRPDTRLSCLLARCWALYGELLAREYSNQDYTYAVQHPGAPDRRTIQSLALHLITLCLALEEGLDPPEGPSHEIDGFPPARQAASRLFSASSRARPDRSPPTPPRTRSPAPIDGVNRDVPPRRSRAAGTAQRADRGLSYPPGSQPSR